MGADFSRIARRYDLVNSLLSLGQEQNWRRRAAAHLPPGRVLDLGSGTGAAAPIFGVRQTVALDPEPAMLARNPLQWRVVGYGEALPFAAASFTGVFSAYVFRNLESVDATLSEINRVLVPGGRAVVVDLTRPRHAGAAALHRTATAALLPLAGMVAGDVAQYRFLHRSLDTLAPPETLFEDGPLRLERIWRMGPMGFVYGAVLTHE